MFMQRIAKLIPILSLTFLLTNLVSNSVNAQVSLTTRLAQYKIKVDDSITNRTAAQSIRPTNVGNRYKDLSDIVKSVVDSVRANNPTLQSVTDNGANTTNIITVGDQAGRYMFFGQYSIAAFNGSNGNYTSMEFDVPTGHSVIRVPDIVDNNYTMAIAETETCDAVFSRGGSQAPLILSHHNVDSTIIDNISMTYIDAGGDVAVSHAANTQAGQTVTFPDPLSDAGTTSVNIAYKESETPDNIFQRGSASQPLTFDNGFNSKVQISPLGAYFSGGGGPTNFAHLSSPVLSGNIDVVLPDHASTIAALDQTGLDSVTARKPFTPFNFGYDDGSSKVSIDGAVKIWDIPHGGLAAALTSYTFSGNTSGGMYFVYNGNFSTRINMFTEPLTANRGQIIPDADGTIMVGNHGSTTFSSGVATITDSRVKSTSVVTIVYDCSSCGAIGVAYKASYSAGTSFTVTSLKVNGTTETSDNNSFRYTITY